MKQGQKLQPRNMHLANPFVSVPTGSFNALSSVGAIYTVYLYNHVFSRYFYPVLTYPVEKQSANLYVLIAENIIFFKLSFQTINPTALHVFTRMMFIWCLCCIHYLNCTILVMSFIIIIIIGIENCLFTYIKGIVDPKISNRKSIWKYKNKGSIV